jgi:leucyl-tRNA synthetase
MMEAINRLYKAKDAHGIQQGESWRFAVESMVQLVAPYAPHIAEELWHDLGHQDSVHVDHWPLWDEALLVTDTMTIAVQVNGKLRGDVEVGADASEDTVIDAAKAQPKVAGYLADHDIKKAIYVPKKLVNFVI